MMLANLTKDLIGQPYELGKMDCLRLVYDYLAKQMEMPEEFQGITLSTYVDVYKSDPRLALMLLEEFIASILPEIAIEEIKPGDIAIARFAYQEPFPVIIVGNGRAILTTEKSVIIVNLNKLKIERAFRCQGHLR